MVEMIWCSRYGDDVEEMVQMCRLLLIFFCRPRSCRLMNLPLIYLHLDIGQLDVARMDSKCVFAAHEV